MRSLAHTFGEHDPHAALHAAAILADDVELDPRVARRISDLVRALREKDALLVQARKRQAALESASRLMTDFLAVLSHEIRTPLQAIYGYADILDHEVHGPLTELQRRDVDRIKRGEEHLLSLVNTILDFAKLQHGQATDAELGPVPIDEVLTALIPLVEPQAAAKGVTLHYAPPAPRLAAYADRGKTQQIILNLLSNAIKFTDAGGTITVEAFAESTDTAVRVRDTGRGIPSDKLDLIFEPFVQIRSGDAGGAGLGLAISRGLAAAMGGSLHAESELGRGATFVLRLPAVART